MPRRPGLLSRMASRELVGIDCTGNTLKIVSAKISPAKSEFTRILEQDISGLAEGDISKIVRASFSKLKFKNPTIVNTIPSHTVITKNIEIPSANTDEIKEIINLQASRYTPYSREEIIVDYIVIDIYKHNYTKILLVIVARNVVKRQFEILERAGIKLDKVILASEGLAWSVPRMLRLETGSAPMGIIHIDEAFSDFIIVSKNKPVFIRSISLGAQHHLEEGEGFKTKFMDEVKKSFEAYQAEDIEKNPRTLVVTGAIDNLKYIESAINDTLPSQAKMMEYLKNISLSKELAKSPPKTERHSFLHLIASLLALDDAKVNLIPEEVKLRKSVEERGRDLIKTGILILAVFILFFSLLISKLYFKNNYLEILSSRYANVHKEAERLEGQFERVSLIRNYLSKRGYSLEVLSEIHEISPLELELNDIRFEQGEKFTIKGTAQSMSTVFSFVDNMEKSPYFQDVKTRYTTKRKDGTRDVTDFEINCVLKLSGEE